MVKLLVFGALSRPQSVISFTTEIYFLFSKKFCPCLLATRGFPWLEPTTRLQLQNYQRLLCHLFWIYGNFPLTKPVLSAYSVMLIWFEEAPALSGDICVSGQMAASVKRKCCEWFNYWIIASTLILQPSPCISILSQSSIRTLLQKIMLACLLVASVT